MASFTIYYLARAAKNLDHLAIASSTQTLRSRINKKRHCKNTPNADQHRSFEIVASPICNNSFHHNNTQVEYDGTKRVETQTHWLVHPPTENHQRWSDE